MAATILSCCNWLKNFFMVHQLPLAPPPPVLPPPPENPPPPPNPPPLENPPPPPDHPPYPPLLIIQPPKERRPDILSNSGRTKARMNIPKITNWERFLWVIGTLDSATVRPVPLYSPLAAARIAVTPALKPA